MRVYIKDMKMPRSCDECRFSVDGWCYALQPEEPNVEVLYSGGMLNACPLNSVGEGKESDYDGLKVKYLVFKVDTGEMVDECFVLRPQKDKAARKALRTYAANTDNPTLSSDINRWLDSMEET